MQDVYASWKLKEQEKKEISKASENMAWKIINVFVQEDIFNEVPNTLVIPNHFSAACIIEVRTALISSPPFEFDGIHTHIVLKTVLFHSTF